MCYTIHELTETGAGPMLDSGMTRYHVICALQRLSLIDGDKFAHPLPRFGKALCVAGPKGNGKRSYIIRHV